MGKAVKSVFGGGGSSPGMLGTGRFKASTIDVDKDAFNKGLAGTGPQEELKKKQVKQTTRLEDKAEGKAPSIAEAELKQASNRSLAQQLAAAKSGRGGSAAARERALATGQAEARRDISEQAAIAKLKERELAEQSLASQLQAQRAQDIALAQSDRASQQALQDLLVKQNLGAQGLNLSGFQSAAQARGDLTQSVMSGAAAMLSDKNCKKSIKKEGNKPSFAKAISTSGEECKKNVKEEKSKIADVKPEPQKIEVEKVAKAPEKKSSDWEPKEAPKPPQKKGKSGSGIDPAQMAQMAQAASAAMSDKNCKKNKKKETAKLKNEKEESSMSKFAKGFNESKKSRNPTNTSFGSSLASRMMSEVSDKSCKENIEQEDFNPKSFLDKLAAYSYEYKNSHKNEDMGGEGRYLSVMAQDLEKAGPVGRSMVKENENGKYVDYGKGFGAILAAQAHLNQRLAELEKKKK